MPDVEEEPTELLSKERQDRHFCRAFTELIKLRKNEKVGSEQHYCKQDKGYGKVVGGVDGSSANMLLWNDGLASPLRGEGLRASS